MYILLNRSIHRLFTRASSLNQGKFSNGKKYSLSFANSHIPCVEILETSILEVFPPSTIEFIVVLLNDFFYFFWLPSHKSIIAFPFVFPGLASAPEGAGWCRSLRDSLVHAMPSPWAVSAGRGHDISGWPPAFPFFKGAVFPVIMPVMAWLFMG